MPTLPKERYYKLLTGFSLNPWFFRHVLREGLYRRYKGDIEKIHEESKRRLNLLTNSLRERAEYFDAKELEVTVGKHKMMPFGLAAGFDKDCEVLLPLSFIFGYLVPGTITLNLREGNLKPRVKAGEEALYNAMGFPSKGLEHSLQNLKNYREQDGKAPVFASFCGIPQEDSLESALEENRILIERLNPYVDGLEWNPSSPNTKLLVKLRTPGTFKQVINAMYELAENRLKFVKLPPYETDEQKDLVMTLVKAWYENGGDGVVLTNTRMVPYLQFPFGTAGESGKPLYPYMLRAVKEVHQQFPRLLIRASGGIRDADTAYETFLAGATLEDLFTVVTYRGLGVVKELIKGVGERLHRDNYANLQQLQSNVRKGERLLV